VYDHPDLDAQLLIADMKNYFALVKRAVKEATPLFKTRCINVGGKSVPQGRQTCFMGGPGVSGFQYSGQFTEADPMSPATSALLALVNGELGTEFNGALLNSYPSVGERKSQIGFHSDAETGLGKGSTVVSISFGGARTFRLKDKKTRKTLFSLKTGPCELMVMKGHDFQPKLLHGIPPQAKCDHRWSITFRKHTVQPDEGELKKEGN